jgi:hypothetical protein
MWMSDMLVAGAKILEADLKLDKVYGDHVHQNSGQHLNSGITEDAIWQGYWRRLIVYHYRKYSAPKGPMVILQYNREAKRAQDIKNRLTRRMNDWGDGNFLELGQETERDMKTFLSFLSGMEHRPSSVPGSATRRYCEGS